MLHLIIFYLDTFDVYKILETVKAMVSELVSNTWLLMDRCIREFKGTVPEQMLFKAGRTPYLNIHITTQAVGDPEYMIHWL